MRKHQRRQRIHYGEAWEKRAVRHAIRRLGERYMLHLDEPGYRRLVALIQAGGAELIHRQTPSRHWYRLNIGGRPVLAVYDTGHRRINTFLAPDALATIGRRPSIPPLAGLGAGSDEDSGKGDTMDAGILWERIQELMAAAKADKQTEGLWECALGKGWVLAVNRSAREHQWMGLTIPRGGVGVAVNRYPVGLLHPERFAFADKVVANLENFAAQLTVKINALRRAA